MGFEGLPGHDLVAEGLADLARGVESVPALLVAIGAPRLRRLGLSIPSTSVADPEHRLYLALSQSGSDSAHARYNALLRKLVSFERAAGCRELTDADRLRRFMQALGAEADREARVYLTGGATAVLLGWRWTTIAADIAIFPESDRLLRAIPRLKETLRMNVELASPAHFIPELPGWDERSPFITREGRVSFHHYDLYAQALSKIERGHAQDRQDVTEMLRRGLVEPARLRELFAQIEPKLYRYPAIDPASFRRAVEDALA